MLLVRNYGLDVLRILLCLTVVVFHYGGEWSCGGGVAVDGFFVLSGFLAVCSARGSAQGNIVEYYRKKCWRLLPVLLIAWAVGLAVLFVEGELASAWPGLRRLVLEPTRAMSQMTGIGSVWFLTCIMFFLALFPWLYRYYGKKIFLWILTASILFAVFRSGMCPLAELYFQVSFRLWQFLLGMWCASWNMERIRISWRWFWIGTGAAWLLASSFVGNREIGFLLNNLLPKYIISSGGFALFISSLWSVRLPSLSKKLLKWLGIGAGMTYALFLFHQPVRILVSWGMKRGFRMLREHAGMDWQEDAFPVLLCGMSLCASLLVSYFVYQYVEVRWVGKRLRKESLARNGVLEGAGKMARIKYLGKDE